MSDIDTAVVDSLKVLDLKWPIREADIGQLFNEPCPKVAPDPFPMPRLRQYNAVICAWVVYVAVGWGAFVGRFFPICSRHGIR